MNTNLLRVAEELASVIETRQYQGVVNPSRAFPFHSQAPDGSYRILWNGDLSVTFRHGPFSRSVFHPLLLSAQPAHSFQLVTHRGQDGFIQSFTSITAPIAYRYNYPPFESYLNAFRPGFRMKEYKRFRDATEEAIQKVTSYASLNSSRDYLTAIHNVNEVTAPLTNIAIQNAIPRFKEEVKYNLSYIKLPDGKCATAVGFLSHENVFQNGVQLPPSSLDTVILSLIRYPDSDALKARMVEIGNHRQFASLFKAVRDESSLLTMDVSRLAILNASRGFADVQTFMLFVSTSPFRLREGVQAYLRELTEREISYSMSFLNTVEAFCSVFPGNVRALREGSLVDFTDVSSVIEGFHAC